MDASSYETMTTAELEALLDDPEVSDQVRWAVSGELARRRTHPRQVR